jgi:hypothetical protein
LEEREGDEQMANYTFKRTSVAFTVVMTVITLGIYMPYWYLSRRKAIHQLAGKEVLPIVLLWIALGLYSISFGISVLTLFSATFADIFSDSDRMMGYLGLAIIIFLSLKTRAVFQQHFRQSNINPVLTVLLTIWYMQYKVNRELEIDAEKE